MRVATLTTLAASKTEPLAELVGRVRQAFLNAGLGEPAIRFTFVDSPTKNVLPVDRALKRYPEMERFLVFRPLIPSSPTDSRMLSNSATGEPADYATLNAILAGVPRSYPFLGVWFHFHAPAWGERLIGLPKMGHSLPGVLIVENSGVKGRQRALSAYTVVEAEAGDKTLPPNPEPVDAVMKACGKVRRTEQVPIRAPGGGLVGAIPAENAAAVKAIVADYRARIHQIVERAGMPHNLPLAAEIQDQNAGIATGPRKPAAEGVFKPMGYACRGGSGELHLTRRTAGNLTVELYLDVGTWSQEVSALYTIHGAGFRESLPIPVNPREITNGQYPIGDAAQWQKIVENLAAMVRELDLSFVPEIEQVAGPTPAWYKP
jgi:hypothetical protein